MNTVINPIKGLFMETHWDSMSTALSTSENSMSSMIKMGNSLKESIFHIYHWEVKLHFIALKKRSLNSKKIAL